MARVDREQSRYMSEVGAAVKQRRERLGLAIKELAEEAGVSRDTISDLESGRKDFRQLTLSKVHRALDALEHEAGIDAPVPRNIPSTEGGLVELELTIDMGEGEPDARAVVKGPIENLPMLREQLEILVRRVRADLHKGDTPRESE